MKYRQLGSSGLQVSAIGVGTRGLLDPKQCTAVIDQALEEGINFIDTANSYGRAVAFGTVEKNIGAALRGRREQALIATKFSTPRTGPVVVDETASELVRVPAEEPNQSGNSRYHIIQAVEDSLRRLGTDYIDLYQAHWPDRRTPIEETLRALDDLVHQGKVRYIGCSNFQTWQVCEAIWTSKTLRSEPFVSVQPHYSLLERTIERELLPFCERYKIGILPYFPLASGALAGKYQQNHAHTGEVRPPNSGQITSAQIRGRFLTEANLSMIGKLEKFTQERGHSMTELAFGWLLSKPQISSVIAGATTPEQVATNARCVDWDLTQDDLDDLNSILSG